jgi:hypothetical protein
MTTTSPQHLTVMPMENNLGARVENVGLATDADDVLVAQLREVLL